MALRIASAVSGPSRYIRSDFCRSSIVQLSGFLSCGYQTKRGLSYNPYRNFIRVLPDNTANSQRGSSHSLDTKHAH
jgi:hypothetical protein